MHTMLNISLMSTISYYKFTHQCQCIHKFDILNINIIDNNIVSKYINF